MGQSKVLRRASELKRKAFRQPPSFGSLSLELGSLPSSQVFHTWHSRPKRALPAKEVSSDSTIASQEWAIVVQGPMLREHNFTLESLQQYRAFFPSASIILSTWTGELIDHEREKLVEIGVLIVETDQRGNSGPSNLFFQQASTLAGLELAKKLGHKFSVKSRTDQRFYSQDALPFLRRLLELFPSSKGGTRVGAVSLDSFRDMPFGLSDMLQFSETVNLIEFWSFKKFTKHRLTTGECHIAYEYAAKFGISTAGHDDWLNSLRSSFIVCDANSLDLYWRKYSNREHLWRQYSENQWQELDFAYWLALQQ